MILKNIDKKLDYGMINFNTTSKTQKHKKEVKDGLVSRFKMDNTEEIQKDLRNQINKILNK